MLQCALYITFMTPQCLNMSQYTQFKYLEESKNLKGNIKQDMVILETSYI